MEYCDCNLFSTKGGDVWECFHFELQLRKANKVVCCKFLLLCERKLNGYFYVFWMFHDSYFPSIGLSAICPNSFIPAQKMYDVISKFCRINRL